MNQLSNWNTVALCVFYVFKLVPSVDFLHAVRLQDASSRACADALPSQGRDLSHHASVQTVLLPVHIVQALANAR